MFHLALYLIPKHDFPLSAVISGTGKGKEAALKLINLTLEQYFTKKRSDSLKTIVQDEHPKHTIDVYEHMLVCPFVKDVGGDFDEPLIEWRGEFLLMICEQL